MSSTRELLEAAAERVTLLPALPPAELAELAAALPAPLPADFRDLLQFCSGIEGAVEEVDFTGRSLSAGFGLDFLVPHPLPIAHDGCGNYWVIDLRPGDVEWGPVYFCCHDAPVMLLQAANVQQFVADLLQPHPNAMDDVREDRRFNVWGTNPGVIAHADAMASPDSALRNFASALDPRFELIDLRDAPTGMGFSWGRYGPRTDVRRFGLQPVFAYRGPDKKPGLFTRLFGK